MTEPFADTETARIAALHRLQVLDTEPEVQFDKIVGLVRTVFDVPIVTVTLVDQHRQWFKAQAGMPVAETPRSTSFCTHTVAARAPLMIPDALADPRVAHSPLVVGDPHIRSYLGVPLMTPDGHAIGALCAIDTEPRAFTPAQIDLLAGFAKLVVDELELRRIAATDPLTGALSRRGFVAALDTEIARCRRYGRVASLALLDADHFKRVNDSYGHPAGDLVLREIVSRTVTMLRPIDVVGRLGGEEFAILLPETGAGSALATIGRIRRGIAGTPFVIGTPDPLTVTASFGVASLADDDTSDSWLARADTGLYLAKRSGRNRAELIDHPPREAAA